MRTTLTLFIAALLSLTFIPLSQAAPPTQGPDLKRLTPLEMPSIIEAMRKDREQCMEKGASAERCVIGADGYQRMLDCHREIARLNTTESRVAYFNMCLERLHATFSEQIFNCLCENYHSCFSTSPIITEEGQFIIPFNRIELTTETDNSETSPSSSTVEVPRMVMASDSDRSHLNVVNVPERNFIRDFPGQCPAKIDMSPAQLKEFIRPQKEKRTLYRLKDQRLMK